MSRRPGSFLAPTLLLLVFLLTALSITTVHLVRCELCGGRGERFVDEIGGTWINLACPRCCPHGFIEPGRKVTLLRNWLPGLTPRLTRADVERALRQADPGPNSPSRYSASR